MGEIIESMRRHYVGDDADKGSIPAGGKDFGDSYHANDKGKQYYWNGAAWKTGLGYEYVSRSPNAWDFDLGYFHNPGAGRNIDGTWQVDKLDLSGIVPEGAVAVILTVLVKDDAAASNFQIRQNAGAVITPINFYTQVANIFMAASGVLPIDSNRLLDYQGTNLVWTNIRAAVHGWFI